MCGCCGGTECVRPAITAGAPILAHARFDLPKKEEPKPRRCDRCKRSGCRLCIAA